MAWSTSFVTLANGLRGAARNRIAWLMACLHALWFVLSVANMSPPSPALGRLFDNGGWSSATLFAGRPFHFHYEALGMKFLVLLDLPAMVVMIPVSLLLVPLPKMFGSGFYSASYSTAALMLLGGTCQWLLIGRKCEQWVGRKLPVLHRGLHRLAGFLIAAMIIVGCVLAPVVNERSRLAGFKHSGISFR